jgi:DNA-cytosine methyltransferase
MNKLKLLDLFSGIGGFSLGLESTGYFQTIAFVEKDKFCRQVLQKNFNNIPIEEDIRNVRGSNYAADVITGGFPCQPFSVAGKRKGTADDRYLWDETIRVVAECKPRWFIGENVEGLININNGMVLRQVQTDLEEQGFQVQCIVIPASGIGAWHQRKRIWIVAYSDSNRHSNKIRGSSTKEERISQEHRQDHNTTRKSSRASSVWETNNQYVPNSSGKRSSSQSIGVNRELAEESSGEKKQGINLHFALRHHVQMYPTPTQDSASERTKKYKQGGTPLPTAVKMFPTPTAGCVEGGEQSSRVEMTENGGFILRKKNKPEMTFGAKLSDAMIFLEKMYPTPMARDHKDMGYNPITCKREIKQQSIPTTVLKNNKPGGKLNPNFVEFLMGYPMNWTKIDQAE